MRGIDPVGIDGAVVAFSVAGMGLDGPGRALQTFKLVLSVPWQADALGVVLVGDPFLIGTHELDHKSVLTPLSGVAGSTLHDATITRHSKSRCTQTL